MEIPAFWTRPTNEKSLWQQVEFEISYETARES